MMLLLSMAATLSFAETYKVIVGTPPGSGSDTQARRVFDLVSKETGDTFIIMNKPGGAFVVSYRVFQEESKTSPNVLLLTHGSTLITSYVTNVDQKLDPLTETKGLIAFQRIRHFIVVREESNIQTAKDIKGKLNIGYSTHQKMKVLKLC
jgi:tripartite-type tricarboxylate transporter receptor subunit TctC